MNKHEWIKINFTTLKHVFLLLVVTTFGSIIALYSIATTDRQLWKPTAAKKFQILMYNEPISPDYIRFMKLGLGQENCSNCDVIEQYDGQDTIEYDAIVFTFNRIKLTDPVFKRRHPEQLYVWHTIESTSTVLYFHHSSMEGYSGVFNLTMTHRRDSDVWTPYGTIPEIKNALREKFSPLTPEVLNEVVNRKKSLVVWVVSNCGLTLGAKRRLEIVNELKKTKIGSRLELYGSCGEFWKSFKTTKSGYEKMNSIIQTHKFYLAFENSYHCRDYITEKFWQNSLLNAAVPIVWGPKKNEVLEVAPSGSFIHFEDFKNITELADYLLYLDRNDTAYKEYFSWWFQPNEDIGPLRLCKLCAILNDNNRKPQSINYFESWFYSNEHGNCLLKQL
uniref:Fucosyltransferase n=1 Tax=Ciona savignyi TaxID=51511 RepID=H2Y8P9_CIOSA